MVPTYRMAWWCLSSRHFASTWSLSHHPFLLFPSTFTFVPLSTSTVVVHRPSMNWCCFPSQPQTIQKTSRLQPFHPCYFCFGNHVIIFTDDPLPFFNTSFLAGATQTWTSIYCNRCRCRIGVSSGAAANTRRGIFVTDAILSSNIVVQTFCQGRYNNELLTHICRGDAGG